MTRLSLMKADKNLTTAIRERSAPPHYDDSRHMKDNTHLQEASKVSHKITDTTVDHHHSTGKNIPVWDLLLRALHWGLAAGFTVAYATEDDLMTVHTWSGYVVLTIITVRLVWGFLGPRYARWSHFIRAPGEILAYLADVTQSRADRYLGHNPAGGAMVVALMMSIAATGISGLALYGAQDLSGPLAGLMSSVPPSWGKILEEVHEVLANLALFLVLFHLIGVALTSVQHSENLIKAMITGRKRVD